jgi:AhpD family alkylhydroperoxidase
MSLVKQVEYAEAGPEVRGVYDEIKTVRKVATINNFWKVLANDPGLLKRTWEEVRDVMAPGALDPLTKEMIYVAVSATNNCEYCTHSHTASARKQGMSDAMLAEVLAVTALANKTNRLANGYRVDVDEAFKPRFD